MNKQLLTIAQNIPVTQYMEYQDYLQAIYLAAKAEFASYSYLRLAEDLGFAATNVLRLVIARKRRLSDKSARTIAAKLQLRKENKQYFLNLVRYGNVPSQETKTEIFMRIYDDKKSSVADASDKDLMDFYAAWYHPLVLELINVQVQSGAPENLLKYLYPRLLPDQLNKAIELLQRLQMIEWDEAKHCWVALDQSPKIVPEDRAAGLYSLVQFHLQMLEVAAQALLLVPRQEREFNAMTIKLGAEQIPALKDKVREFCAGVMAMEQQAADSDRIVQVNIQMFPFTKNLKDQEKVA